MLYESEQGGILQYCEHEVQSYYQVENSPGMSTVVIECPAAARLRNAKRGGPRIFEKLRGYDILSSAKSTFFPK